MQVHHRTGGCRRQLYSEPKRDIDQPYLMPIEDVFTIEGRGTVVTGRVERGIVKVNEDVESSGQTDASARP